jgi:hypothetical protein
MPTLRTMVFAVLGLAGLVYGIQAERTTRETARKEAVAWDEVRKLEHQLLSVRLEVQDCERRLYLTENVSFCPVPAAPASGITFAVVPQPSPTS